MPQIAQGRAVRVNLIMNWPNDAFVADFYRGGESCFLYVDSGRQGCGDHQSSGRTAQLPARGKWRQVLQRWSANQAGVELPSWVFFGKTTMDAKL